MHAERMLAQVRTLKVGLHPRRNRCLAVLTVAARGGHAQRVLPILDPVLYVARQRFSALISVCVSIRLPVRWLQPARLWKGPILAEGRHRPLKHRARGRVRPHLAGHATRSPLDGASRCFLPRTQRSVSSSRRPGPSAAGWSSCVTNAATLRPGRSGMPGRSDRAEPASRSSGSTCFVRFSASGVESRSASCSESREERLMTRFSHHALVHHDVGEAVPEPVQDRSHWLLHEPDDPLFTIP